MLTEIADFGIFELWVDQSGLSTLALYITSRAGETSGRKYFWTMGIELSSWKFSRIIMIVTAFWFMHML
jgi:hypothetical protein